MAILAAPSVTLHQDAELAFAIITRREDVILRRIFSDLELTGTLNPHWAAAENLGIETYAVAKRCRWTRPDGKPDTNRARDAMEYLCKQRRTMMIMRVAYPVRSYYATLDMLRALERQRARKTQ